MPAKPTGTPLATALQAESICLARTTGMFGVQDGRVRMKTLAGTTWRAVEVMAVDGEGREVPSPIGQHPLGLVSFEKDRMLVALTDARPSPSTPVRALIAYTGTYRFDGAELVTDADVASRPDLVAEQVRSISFESPTRMVVSPKNDFLGGGQAIGLSIVWERIG
jgi:hypothetical protein